MAKSMRQFDLFETIIPPDTPLGNFQCCLAPAATKATEATKAARPPLPPSPKNPLDHHQRFGVSAEQHVEALEWLSDNDQAFVDLENRLDDLEQSGDMAGAAAVQDELDQIVADYLQSVRQFEPKTPLLDATKATEATEAPEPAMPTQSPARLKWNQLAQGRKALVAALEAHLREKGLPYVAVDEAKKAIFNDSDIDAFDYLAYSSTGPNLLALAITRRPTPAQVEQMRQWEQVFGKDFQAAFAFQAAGDWRILSLKDVAAQDPLALSRSLDQCLNRPL